MTTIIKEDAVNAYADAWLADMTLPEVSEEERQVALVLCGYNTPSHGALMGISDQARAFANAHWGNR